MQTAELRSTLEGSRIRETSAAGATIVSGGVAERVKSPTYAVYAFFMNPGIDVRNDCKETARHSGAKDQLHLSCDCCLDLGPLAKNVTGKNLRHPRLWLALHCVRRGVHGLCR